MKRSMKRFLTLVAAVAAILGLSHPANAGKGGSPGGMSRGGSSGGMSRSGFGGGMSRSMGSMSGMNARSMGGSGMSPRSFSAPARGMARPSLGHGTSMQGAARHFNSSVPRGRGANPLGGVERVVSGRSGVRIPSNGGASDRTKAGSIAGRVLSGNSANASRTGALSDLMKGRVIGDKPGRVISPIVKRTGIADRLKAGRINTGDIAKIDRSKLRDLVKGIEIDRSVPPVSGRPGPVIDGLDKVKVIDSIRQGGLRSFNPGGLLAGNVSGASDFNDSFVAGGCFPHPKDCHDGHWFDVHFGSFCFGYGYGYDNRCHDYDYCWQPYYTYPPCGVTLAAYPEVVTVATTQPIVIEQEANLESTADKPAEADAAAAADLTPDESHDAVTGLAAEEEKSRDPAEAPEFDVELIDVEMVAAGDHEAKVGPRFKVVVRNSGKRDLEKFLVSLVACKGAQIDSSALHASTTVEGLAAGEERTLEMTLPVETLSLNRDAQGRMAPFSTLIAAVDSDERVNEGDEENNLALIDRTSIKLASR